MIGEGCIVSRGTGKAWHETDIQGLSREQHRLGTPSGTPQHIFTAGAMSSDPTAGMY